MSGPDWCHIFTVDRTLLEAFNGLAGATLTYYRATRWDEGWACVCNLADEDYALWLEGSFEKACALVLPYPSELMRRV